MKNIWLFLLALPMMPIGLCRANDFDFGGDIDFSEDSFFDDFFEEEGFNKVEENNKLLLKNVSSTTKLDEISLWRKTAGFRTRDPLFLLPNRRLTVDDPGFFCNFFFNMSNTMPVRPDLVLSTKAVDMLVDFTESGALSGIDLTDLDGLLKVLPFIDKMTVQERKIGGMLQLNVVKNRWVLQLNTLLMLVERNFWAKNKSDRTALLNALGDSGKGEAYRMKFGLGDTKLRLGYKVSDNDILKAVVGAAVTIPTSRIGRSKPKCIVKSKVGDSRKKLIDDLMNMNKQLMINPKLGTGHWGLGVFLDTRIHLIPDKLDFWSRLSFDYLFAGNEYRYMPSNKSISLKTLGDLTSNDTIQEGFPISDLFPCLAKGRVSPGSIFNATVGFDWMITKNWTFGLGYDFYSQQAEKISRVSAPNVSTSLLRVDESIASKIMQHKVFAKLMYTHKGKSMDWHFGISGDTTFSSQGGPRDWTVGANIGITF